MKDLTKIKTPFGLLKPNVQNALRAHGGPYEVYVYRGWQSTETPFTDEALSYRVKPTENKTVAALREEFSPHLIFAAVNEWQKWWMHRECKYPLEPFELADIERRYEAATQALLRVKVPS